MGFGGGSGMGRVGRWKEGEGRGKGGRMARNIRVDMGEDGKREGKCVSEHWGRG